MVETAECPEEADIMALTRQALESLIDLVENKLSMLEVVDRDDAVEAAHLKQCLEELTRFSRGEVPVIDLNSHQAPRKRGRRPKRPLHGELVASL